MSPRLIGISGPLQGTNFLVPAEQISIGRDESNHLACSDPSLSRRHCALVQEGERFKIQDLGSHNGTRVNGIPVEQHFLHNQDEICIGNSVVLFVTEEQQVNPERNRVVLTETVDLGATAPLVSRENTSFQKRERVADAMPGADRTTRDLRSLLTIATGIGTIRNRESLEWQLLGMIFDMVPADRGAILHLSEEMTGFEAAIAWDRIRGPGHPVEVSQAVVQQVVNEHAGLLVGDVATERGVYDREGPGQPGVHSLLCVPLLSSGTLRGVIYLDSRHPSERLDVSHLEMINAVASLASIALENIDHWEALEEENRVLRAEISLGHDMVGGSFRMREVYDVIRRVALTDSTVLIQGETGTGKELVARAIHRNSSRASRPFVALNCAALTETLLESELFGHEKGAFTGATTQKKGKLEVAEGGTLFLDEVSEMTAGMQSKLLRVLQEREFERVGGTRTIKIDVRVIAATNKSLSQLINAGTFRQDLYYRLNVVNTTIPPLRERREDIPALAEHFVAKASRRCKTRIKQISAEAESFLMSYSWPGNVRQLENAIEHAMVLGAADRILPEDLPESVLETVPSDQLSSRRYDDALREFKKQLVLQALQGSNGNYVEAAHTLGLHPNSLLRLIRNLGLKSGAKSRNQLSDDAC